MVTKRTECKPLPRQSRHGSCRRPEVLLQKELLGMRALPDSGGNAKHYCRVTAPEDKGPWTARACPVAGDVPICVHVRVHTHTTGYTAGHRRGLCAVAHVH